MGPYQVLPLQVRVDLGARVMKRYSVFPKAPALLERHHQICLMSYPEHSRRGWGGVGHTPVQRCSWYILQPQLTGLSK